MIIYHHGISRTLLTRLHLLDAMIVHGVQSLHPIDVVFCDHRRETWFPHFVAPLLIIIIIYRFLERHILKALWRFTILKINNLTNQKTIKSLSKKKGLEAPFECV